MARSRYTAGDGSVERAQKERREPTTAETRFWSIVRDRRLGNAKFRRQQRFGVYTADFVCHDAKFVVEIDGDTHATNKGMEHDARRTRFIEGEGYRVMRFSNADVMDRLEGVATVILAELGPSPSHPAAPGRPLPLPRRGEGS